MTSTGEQATRTLILDPDLGPVEMCAGEAKTVTSLFGGDESSPWHATD
ncbi:hypothetical protein [Nocardia rhizosphaerae]|uniref:Uncharacterized protein n=1 Tax=Nocardia rhizosphaerae TaxID=1691571 RepID=A0ABV8L9C4_9NOCA